MLSRMIYEYGELRRMRGMDEEPPRTGTLPATLSLGTCSSGRKSGRTRENDRTACHCASTSPRSSLRTRDHEWPKRQASSGN